MSQAAKRQSRMGVAVASVAAAVVVAAPSEAGFGPSPRAEAAPARPGLEGTVWVGNREWNDERPELVAYDATDGRLVRSVQLEVAASDLATGKGKVFVGEESKNRIRIIDGSTGAPLGTVATSSKPHHLSSSRGGNLIAYGAFGTNRVGVIDAGTGEVVGEWAASESPAARVHAAAFSPDGTVVYTANDGTGEVGAVDIRSGELWTARVPRVHELIVSPNGRFAYVSCRSDDKIRILDLVDHTVTDFVSVPRPDTLQLSANGKQLTVGLRNGPNVAVIDTESAKVTTVSIADRTLAGHQWTAANGHHTFVAYEGSPAGTAVIEHQTNTVMEELPYPGGGQPHGIAYLAPHGG